MNRQVIAGLIGAALAFLGFVVLIGPLIDNTDMRAVGIGVSGAGGAMLGERFAARMARAPR